MYPRPSERPAILGLYETTWPPLPELIERCAAHGWLWSDVSTPFLSWDPDVPGRALSHAGVLSVPLCLGGQEQLWAGVHAVCTRPERRGQGLNRPVMEAALEHIDRGPFAGAFLTTEEPALYTRYGFRVLPEHRFLAPRPDGAGRLGEASRPLDDDDLADVALLRRILRTRRPLSSVMSTRDSGWLTAMCGILYYGSLSAVFHHIPALDAVVALMPPEEGASRLQILDVASPRPLTLEALCAHLPGDYEAVELLLCAEHLAPEATAVASASPDGTVFMVRGSWPLPAGTPASLPQLSRC